MPVAWLPGAQFEQMVAALEELSREVRAALVCRPADATTGRVLADLTEVTSELTRHRGGDEETCLLSRETVFGLGGLLERAGRELANRGWYSGSFALRAIEHALVELITDAQPA